MKMRRSYVQPLTQAMAATAACSILGASTFVPSSSEVNNYIQIVDANGNTIWVLKEDPDQDNENVDYAKGFSGWDSSGWGVNWDLW